MKEYYLRQLRQKVVDETFADFNLIEFEGKGLTPEMLPMVINACLARQRSYGQKADCGEKHQRHAGIRQHGCPVCG